jgi:hypothetical protein
VRAKDTPDLLAAELNLLVFFELLGQVMIVKSLVLPPGSCHHPTNGLLLDLAPTESASVAMNHSLSPMLLDPHFDPIALPLADCENRCGFCDRQFPPKYSLNYL